MKTFKIKQGIDENLFFYIQVYRLGIPWRTENVIHACFGGSISELRKFNSIKAARKYIKKTYGSSAVIKTTL